MRRLEAQRVYPETEGEGYTLATSYEDLLT